MGVIAGTSVAFATAAESRPLRVGIPAVNLIGRGSPSLQQSFAQVTARLARERAADCGSLALVSQGRCDAIAREISGGLRRRPADPLAEFRQFQPVDAVVWWSLDDKLQVEVLVCTDSGTASTQFDARPQLTKPEVPAALLLAEVAGEALRFVAAALPISAEDRTAIAGDGPFRLDAIAVANSTAVPERDIDQWLLKGASNVAYGIAPLYGLNWKLDQPNLAIAAEILRLAYVPLAAHAERTPAGLRTSPVWLAKNARDRWTVIVKSCYLEVLGTAAEPLARRVAMTAPAMFAAETIELARPLFVEFALEKAIDIAASADALDAGLGFGPGADGLDGPAPRSAGAGPEAKASKPQGGLAATSAPRTQRLGAVRMLGPLGTPEAVEMLAAALGDRDPEIRLAAAFSAATAEPPPSAVVAKLESLVAGPDPAIGSLAALALERAGRDSPRLLSLARQVAAGDSLAADEAALTVARLATAADAALLRSIVDRRPAARPAAIRAALRLGVADVGEIAAWLGSSDELVVAAALDGLVFSPRQEPLEERLLSLADDPFQPVAAAARAVLRRHRPDDPWRQRVAALRAEHPYVRERILEEIATDPDPRAAALLEQACGNRDAQVRTVALRILADRDPATARKLLPAALADGNDWGAFHAAVLAPLLASADLLPALEAAAARPLGSAAEAYLAEAIAIAKGEPIPPPRPAARPLVHPDGRSYAWGMNPGIYAASSPFEAFYCLDAGRIDLLEKASRAGKVLVARAIPLRVPARIVFDPAIRDDLINQLDSQLFDRAAAVLDGIVYGEETFEFPSDEFWDEAWQLFCRDAQIDEARIAGRLENLNPFEQRAWGDWIRRIHIRGYNLLYDLTKLRVGKLRPGLAIGTFQSLGHRQKNDFFGVYDYKGDSRLCAYDLVRWRKTTHPDLPVLWLSLGIGGYEMNPVRDTDQVRAGPFFESWGRCWSDAVTAWLAGAETGWFSVWIFVNPKKGRTDSGMSSLRGKTVWVDDIGPKSPVLDEAVRYAFNYDTKYEEPVTLPGEEEDDLEKLLGDPDVAQEEGQARLDASIAARKAAMKLGFLYNQQHVYDCARIIASLPRPVHEPQGLVYRGGVSVWTRPGSSWPLVPAAALLSRYDSIANFDDFSRLDLSGRRLIVVHAPVLMRDEAIRSLDAWLRDHPGLLVVHLDMPADDAAEASTVEDHDGKLEADWPWEADVACHPLEGRVGRGATPLALDFRGRPLELASGNVGSHFTLTGTAATPLATAGDKTVLAVWSKPGYRGAVLFDGLQHTSGEYLAALREVMNDLHRTRGIGTIVEGPALIETLVQGPLRAAAATRYYHESKDSVQVPGLDLLTGSRNSSVGRLVGSVSSVTAAGHVSGHVATTNALVTVAEKPFTAARIEGDALELEGGGAIRIMAGSAGIEVTAGGRPVAVTAVVEHGTDTAQIDESGFGHWLFADSADGLWEVQGGPGGRTWFLRSQSPVVIRPVAGRVEPPPSDVDPADLAAREAAAALEAAAPAPRVEASDLDLGGGVKLPLVRVEAIGGWVGRFEVTNEQYRRFRADHDSGPGCDAPRQPVVNVSHADAVAFARWANDNARGLPPGSAARLPGAAEWLAIARCGDARRYPWGDAWPPTRGNYDDRRRGDVSYLAEYRDGWPAACVVEASGRNEWGLYGVGGNVWEWTDEPEAAAAGWAIRRGGAWQWELWSKGAGYAEDLRCDHRSYAFPELRSTLTGFRIVVAPASAD